MKVTAKISQQGKRMAAGMKAAGLTMEQFVEAIVTHGWPWCGSCQERND